MRDKTLIKISACCILLITFLAFVPSLKNGFTNWDDNVYLTANTTLQTVSFHSLNKVITSPLNHLYIPLVSLAFSLEYHFFQLNPFIYHAINLIFHLLDSLLVFWMIFLLSKKIGVSFLSALIFGIHPLHVEPVAWISGQKDVLYAFFFLLALIYYLRYLKIQSRNYYCLSLFAFTLSLLIKPIGVTMALLLLIFDYLEKRKIDSSALKDKIPFLAVAIIAMAVNLSMPLPINSGPSQLFGFFDRLLISNYAVVFYLKKLLLPVNLSCLYPYPDKIHGLLPEIFNFSPAIVASLTAAIILTAKSTRKVVFGSLFFFIALLPVLQLIPAPHLAITTDRYAYIASIGIFYIASEGFFWFYQRISKYHKVLKFGLRVILIAGIGALFFLTYQRTKVWKDSITLWSDVLKNYPNLPTAYNNRGNAYSQQGNLPQAISDYSRAIAINPDHADAYYNRGIAYYAKGNLPQAISDFTRAIAINPNYEKAHRGLGVAYYGQGNFSQAISEFTRAIAINPDYTEAYCNRGAVFGKQGNFSQAISDFTRAIDISPGYADAYYNRGIAYYATKEYGKAWVDMPKAKELGFKVDSRLLEDLRKLAEIKK